MQVQQQQCRLTGDQLSRYQIRLWSWFRGCSCQYWTSLCSYWCQSNVLPILQVIRQFMLVNYSLKVK